MKITQKAAILDVDGTLCPGALGIELLRALMRAGACDRDAAQEVLAVLAEHRAGRVDFGAMAVRAYRAYASALAGVELEIVEAVARELWSTQRRQLFEFVPALLECLREHGFEPMLISGSPLEMVRLVADELGVVEAHGAVFGRHDGRYTGEVDLSSGVPGEKARIFAAATRGRELVLARCLAIGDSLTDVALFERVGLALAFEPDAELSAIAAARGWATATREDVLEQTLELLSSPAHCPLPSPRSLRERSC